MAIQDFWEWVNRERRAKNLTYAEMERIANVGNATIGRPARNLTTPTAFVCKAIATALEMEPEDVQRRAGLLDPVLPAVAEEDELIRILRGLRDEPRRTVAAMLRGLARRPALNDSRPGYGPLSEDEQQLVSICRQLDPPRRIGLLEAARVFALNAHAGEPRIIGDEAESERIPPSTN